MQRVPGGVLSVVNTRGVPGGARVGEGKLADHLSDLVLYVYDQPMTVGGGGGGCAHAPAGPGCTPGSQNR